jgi:hypothetical protein
VSERGAGGWAPWPGPSFDDLVGEDLSLAERERLLRVHQLLLEAGPPPDVAPDAQVVDLRPRRRRGVLLALAAAFVAAAFAVGVLVGDRTAGRTVDFDVAMTGTPAAPRATATLTVFDLDDAGNWPMEVAVEGLPPAESGRPFEMWLTKDGDLAVLCGSFRTSADGSASVPMNAPYKFKEYDGWMVVEEGTTAPLLTT